MGIGWWSALQAIPWGQVIEHAPVVLKGARRLMERHRGEPPPPEPPPAAPAEAPADPRTAQLEAGLAQVQARLAELAGQQRQSDEVLASLAEQNARLVAAVETLRLRQRLLTGALALLGVATAGLAVALLYL